MQRKHVPNYKFIGNIVLYNFYWVLCDNMKKERNKNPEKMAAFQFCILLANSVANSADLWSYTGTLVRPIEK